MRLEPLDWPPASATLICFPQDRNIGRARRVAQTYVRRPTERAREAYLAETCQTLAGVMQRRGFERVEIERQIMAFRIAVAAELARQCDTHRQG